MTLGWTSRGFRFLGCLVLCLGISIVLYRPAPEVRAAEEAPDFSMIPPDAAAFLTINFAEVWESPALKEVRKVVETLKGDDYLRQTIGLRLHEIERVTFLLPSVATLSRDGPNVSIILTTKKPYDKVKILDAFDAFSPKDRDRGPPRGFEVIPPKAVPVEIKEAKQIAFRQKPKDEPERDLDSVIYSGAGDTLIYFLGERTIMFTPEGERNLGPATHLGLLLRKGKNGKLAPALAVAATGKHHVVGGLDLSQIKRTFGNELPEEFPGVGLLGADLLTLKFDLADEMRLSLTLDSPDAKSGKQVEQSAKGLLELATESFPEFRKMVGRDGSAKLLLPALEQFERALKATTVKSDSTSVVLGMSMKTDGVFAGMLAQGVVEVRKASERTVMLNNFKQVVLALHNFHDAYNHFPFPGYDNKGQFAQTFDAAKLSWRVALLPYIEQENLFRQFKLDEPWDSENNKKLIPLMPKIYAARKDVNLKEGHTFVQMFQGTGGLPARANFATVTDGLSNTIFFAEAGEGVIWTKPDDMKFDPNKDLPKLGGNFEGNFIVAMGDGSVRFVERKKVSDATLKLLIQPADGNVIPNDW